MDAGRSERMRAISDAILNADGRLDPRERRAAFQRAEALARGTASPRGELSEPLAGFVDKVSRHAYKVTDSDIQELRESGYSEDAIFEAVISTAVGAGLSRLKRGLDALETKR